jgi:prepilin-type N-terminal cleavage/methylation domain-containing protein
MRSSAAELQIHEAGFTLVELLVVIVVIGVLTTVAVVSYFGFSERASRTAAQSNVRVVVPALTAFYSEHSTYVGATLTALREQYDLQIDDTSASRFKLSSLAGSSFCVQNHVGDWYAWTTGLNEPIDAGTASHC